MKKRLPIVLGALALAAFIGLSSNRVSAFSGVTPVGPPANGQSLTGNGTDGTVARWTSYYGQPAVVNSNYITESATGVTIAGATSFSTNLSSFTVANATGVYTQTTLNVCVAKSTVSLTLPTGITTIWVGYAGASSATVAGSTTTIGVLLDSGYATIAGVAETSGRGIVTVGNGQLIGSNDVNLSFGPLPISGLSAGTHTLCLLLDNSGGAVSLDSSNEISAFTASYFP